VSSYAFTDTQSRIVTGDKVRRIVGDETADRVRERFERQRPGADGDVRVDLKDDELAVIAALREISPDAEDSAEQQATETLLKRLAGDRDGPA
jgi:hypothetical protein